MGSDPYSFTNAESRTIITSRKYMGADLPYEILKLACTEKAVVMLRNSGAGRQLFTDDVFLLIFF